MDLKRVAAFLIYTWKVDGDVVVLRFGDYGHADAWRLLVSIADATADIKDKPA